MAFYQPKFLRSSLLAMVLAALLIGCRSGSQLPDVSGYPAQVAVQRFDADFFALDTTRLEAGLQQLVQRYPQFAPSYLQAILGLSPGSPEALQGINAFLGSYRPVQAQASQIWVSHEPEVKAGLARGLQYMQHYFPKWKPEQPFVITTFVGPMDAFEPFSIGDYGDVRTADGVGIALQLHLGAQASVYEEGRKAGIFYEYQTRRFTPDMMVVNAMKNILEDAYPYQPATLTLGEDMIEKGKRLYALKKVLPATPDSLLLGYTAAQLKGSEANEALIWNFFIKNDLLYSKDPMINQNYIKDGPNTAELGNGAPGYIGLFAGWQVVKAFMAKNPGMSLDVLLKTPAREVLDGAGYKP